MPACTEEVVAGPSKPAFHLGLGVEGTLLSPSDNLRKQQSTASAAGPSSGAEVGGKKPTASTTRKFSYAERSAGHIFERQNALSNPKPSEDWLKKVVPKQATKISGSAKEETVATETPGPSAKKTRVQVGRSFAQIAKERILIWGF